MVSDSFGLDGRFRIYNIGFELGYQFVFFKQLCLDMVLFAPSISNYNARLSLIGDVTVEEANQYYQDYQDIVLDRFPWIEELIKNSEVESNGKLNTWSLGFQYTIHLGFLF